MKQLFLAVVLLLTGRPHDAEKSVRDAERHGFRVPAAVALRHRRTSRRMRSSQRVR